MKEYENQLKIRARSEVIAVLRNADGCPMTIGQISEALPWPSFEVFACGGGDFHRGTRRALNHEIGSEVDGAIICRVYDAHKKQYLYFLKFISEIKELRSIVAGNPSINKAWGEIEMKIGKECDSMVITRSRSSSTGAFTYFLQSAPID